MQFQRVIARCVPAVAARHTTRCTPSCMASRVTVVAPMRAAAASTATPVPSRTPTKYTTHIAGLDVVPNGREVFIGLQKEILASIKEYNKALPSEPACNEYARRFAEHRLKVAEEEDDVSAIESRLWSGQIEELIEQAENELDAIVLMNEEVKPWEKPSTEQQAQFDQLSSPNFGQDVDQYRTGKPVQLTKEEQAQVEEFWKPIDEEIRQDQAREAEERAARKAKRAQ